MENVSKQEHVIMAKYSAKILDAMKAHATEKRETYKLIKSKLDTFQKQPNAPELTEAVEFQILSKMQKELVEEIENNEKVGHTDRANELKAQLETVSELLPKAASEDDIKAAVNEYISANGQFTQKEMGQVMAYLKSKFTAMDGKLASTVVRSFI